MNEGEWWQSCVAEIAWWESEEDIEKKRENTGERQENERREREKNREAKWQQEKAYRYELSPYSEVVSELLLK